MLRKVYKLEVLEREIKRTNVVLTKKKNQLNNSLLEMKRRYILLQKMNQRFMRDNTKLYKMIRILRLQVENSKSNPSSQTHFALETLAEAVVSLQNLEAAHDIDFFPNLMQVEGVPEDQQQS